MFSVDQRVKLQIGEIIVQNIVQQKQIEDLQKEIEDLKKPDTKAKK